MAENKLPKFIAKQVDGLQRELRPTENSERKISAIFTAWLRDRAEQYSNDSCCRCVFDELITSLQNGEPWEAFRHGELDDLLKYPCVRAVAGESLLRPAAKVHPGPLPPTNYRRPKGHA